MNPKISIVIPTFLQMECSSTTKYPYFQKFEPSKECIDSIEKQKYKNWEIIYADYKSKDGFEARNKAAKKAKGDIIFFLCPLSILTSNNELSKLVSIFNKTMADAVTCSSVENDNMDLFKWLIHSELGERERKMGEGWSNIGCSCYLAVKKSVFRSVGGFQDKSPTMRTSNRWFNSAFPDWDFTSILIERGYKIWHTNKVTVYHSYRTAFIPYLKKQSHQAEYRVAFHSRFGKFSDDYTKHAFIPPVLSIYSRNKDKKIFLLIPIAFVRYFSWGTGFVKGFLESSTRKERR